VLLAILRLVKYINCCGAWANHSMLTPDLQTGVQGHQEQYSRSLLVCLDDAYWRLGMCMKLRLRLKTEFCKCPDVGLVSPL